MKISLTIAFLFFITDGFSQRNEIDNLRKILPTLQDSSKVDCLNALSFQYVRLLRRDSAEYFQMNAYQESKALHYIQGIAAAINNKSSIYNYFDNDFLKSESFARESISWYDETANKKGIENAENNLFFSLMAQSKFDEAYQIKKRQYEGSYRLKDTVNIHDALSGMGVIHFQKGNYDSAFFYYHKNYQLALDKKNEIWVSNDLIALGTLYRAIGDYPTALNYYRTVFQTDNKETIQSRIDGSFETWTRMEFAELFALENEFDSAWHYYSLFDTTQIKEKDLRIYLASTGETFFLQKEYKHSLQNLRRALAMHQKLNDRNEIKRVLLDIAKNDFELSNKAAALEYAKKSLEISLETNSLQFIRDAYQIFYTVYDQLHQTDSAYFYYKKYIDIKDMVVSDQTKGKFATYSYEEKLKTLNAEKELQQQQIKQTAQQKLFLIIGISVIILSGVIIIRNVSLKRKNEVQLRKMAEAELQKQKIESQITEVELQNQKTELEMQALRSQMNPHFIFNSLNSINRFILQNNRQQASEYLTKFSRLVRTILQNSQSHFITLESELEALDLYLEMEALRFNFHFTYTITHKEDLDISVIKVPPLIVQPFVENAIWHGLMHKEEPGHLFLGVEESEGLLVFTVRDDGIGRKQSSLLASKSATKHKSLGLKITSDRIAMLNKSNSYPSSIHINDLVHADGSPAGTEVIIKIPIHYD
ncbi:MAG: histidine kinase [Bacteroidetes bacterium]|nr:histidine kinase [Bacteroidota bacterium]